jgi:hypothetical protein
MSEWVMTRAMFLNIEILSSHSTDQVAGVVNQIKEKPVSRWQLE